MLRIRNWERFQHYKHRNPPWIRLYKTLLDDPEFYVLDGEASKTLFMCWLVASEHRGELPPLMKLAFRLHTNAVDLLPVLQRLSHWIEGDASTMLAPRLHDACRDTDPDPESDTERKNPAVFMNGHGKAGRKAKPRHGIKTKNGKRIWLDRGTAEWNDYAIAYAERHGGSKPPTQWNGSGTWFDLVSGDA